MALSAVKEEDEAAALKQLDDDDLGRFVLFVLKLVAHVRVNAMGDDDPAFSSAMGASLERLGTCVARPPRAPRVRGRRAVLFIAPGSLARSFNFLLSLTLLSFLPLRAPRISKLYKSMASEGKLVVVDVPAATKTPAPAPVAEESAPVAAAAPAANLAAAAEPAAAAKPVAAKKKPAAKKKRAKKEAKK